jgi:superfamily II DNA/RNA helicase
MTDEEEEKHIPKTQEAVKRLLEHHEADPNFRGVVYSNYIAAGLTPYSRLLKKKGIKHNVFTGAVSRKEKNRMIEEYNTGKTPVLLVSSSGTEGLDLKGTKLMQVMEPHFNNSKIHQVIGRGIRYKSHAHLPEEERTVKVQKFYTTEPQSRLRKFVGVNAPKATEEWLQERADEKDQITAQIKQVMREAHGLPPVPKIAATPSMALNWMDSDNPILQRFGHAYARGTSSRTFERLTKDTAASLEQGVPFGPEFYMNTVKGRLAQAAIEKALPETQTAKRVAAGVTWFKRNYPGASVAGGMLPRLAV